MIDIFDYITRDNPELGICVNKFFHKRIADTELYGIRIFIKKHEVDQLSFTLIYDIEKKTYYKCQNIAASHDLFIENGEIMFWHIKIIERLKDHKIYLTCFKDPSPDTTHRIPGDVIPLEYSFEKLFR